MRLLLPGTLAAASLVLIGAIAYEAIAPLDPVAVTTPRVASRPTRAVIPAPYVPPSEDLYADIDARPLFSAARAPLADPAQTGVAAAATSDFTLVGVIMGGERAVALLRLKSTSASMSATVGGLVNGWRVARIDATSVTLRSNGGEFVVPLDGPANRPPSAPLQPLPDQPAAAAPAPAAAAAPLAATPSHPATLAPAATAAAMAPKPALPAHPANGTIAPEALRGAPIDPTTGEPTL